MQKLNKDVELIRVFIERWLDKDHGEHAEWAMVEDMRMLLHGLDESILFDKEDNLTSNQTNIEEEEQ